MAAQIHIVVGMIPGDDHVVYDEADFGGQLHKREAASWVLLRQSLEDDRLAIGAERNFLNT
jgi:hypothetical protein